MKEFIFSEADQTCHENTKEEESLKGNYYQKEGIPSREKKRKQDSYWLWLSCKGESVWDFNEIF